jgi:hypothetical protein
MTPSKIAIGGRGNRNSRVLLNIIFSEGRRALAAGHLTRRRMDGRSSLCCREKAQSGRGLSFAKVWGASFRPGLWNGRGALRVFDASGTR